MESFESSHSICTQIPLNEWERVLPFIIVSTIVMEGGVDAALSPGVKDKRSPSISRSEPWTLFGHKTQQSKVVFFSQVIILYIIIITCLVNITIESKNFNLWSTLLASSIGYLLPSPILKNKKNGH